MFHTITLNQTWTLTDAWEERERENGLPQPFWPVAVGLDRQQRWRRRMGEGEIHQISSSSNQQTPVSLGGNTGPSSARPCSWHLQCSPGWVQCCCSGDEQSHRLRLLPDQLTLHLVHFFPALSWSMTVCWTTACLTWWTSTTATWQHSPWCTPQMPSPDSQQPSLFLVCKSSSSTGLFNP